MTQYLSVRFNRYREQTYTYRNTGDPAGVGDTVKVPLPHNRRKDAEVVAVSDIEPEFATRNIMKIVKRAEPEPEPMRDEDFNFGEEDGK